MQFDDLPVNKDPILTPDYLMAIYIGEDNVIRLDSEIMSIVQLDSAMATLTNVNEANYHIIIYPDTKSEFSAFNEVLKLSKKYPKRSHP